MFAPVSRFGVSTGPARTERFRLQATDVAARSGTDDDGVRAAACANRRAQFPAPNAAHWFGTDRVGRDIGSRWLHGGRVSLLIGVSAAALTIGIGALLGAVSGYCGGAGDMAIMRFADVVMSFPGVAVILAVATFLGSSSLNVIALVGLFGWTGTARLVHAGAFPPRTAIRAGGARRRRPRSALSAQRIILSHALPGVIAPLLASVPFATTGAILLEAGLSFLGVDIPLPTSSWGNMPETARRLDVLQDGPGSGPPAAMILITGLNINFIGDGLRGALAPRHSQN